jgi:hypothetical protein
MSIKPLIYYAIRSGDFVKGKAKWYANELLPQLPFFSDVK